MQGWTNDVHELLRAEWEVWLTRREQGKQAEILEQHMAWVEKLLDGAEGGAGVFHNITKSRLWRRGAQKMDDVFLDAQQLQGEEVKRQERKEHGHVDTPEHVSGDTHWENTALQDSEGALPPMRAEEMQRTTSSYKARTGVGTGGCHLKCTIGSQHRTVWESC